MTTIALPEDTSTPERTRRAETAQDDFATAEDRIKALKRQYPAARILTTVESVETFPGGDRIVTMAAAVYLDDDAKHPAATGHATRDTSDPEPLIAARPQEAAETTAISRAIRFLGIEPLGLAPFGPLIDDETLARQFSDARIRAGLSKSEVARRMVEFGFETYSQMTVSRNEKGQRFPRFSEIQHLALILGVGDAP